MTIKSEIEKSRQEARFKMDYYSNPEWSRWTHHVHHKDGNAFNNNPSNLTVLPIKGHLATHAKRRRELKIAQLRNIITQEKALKKLWLKFLKTS